MSLTSVVAKGSNRPRVTDAQEGFVGGLNTTADPSQLQPNEVSRADNFRLTEYGGLTKRLGTQRLHAAALEGGAVIRGGYGWVRPGTTVQQMVIANGRLYTGTYGIPMTWTAQGAAADFGATASPSFAAFRDGSSDVVYIADGGPLNKWNGAAVTTNIAGTPNVSQLAVYNLRLFGCGDPSNPYRIYWSALGNGDSLGNVGAGGGFADIRTFGQLELMSLLPVGGSLAVAHRLGISRFSGWSQDDIAIDSGTRGISSDVGTAASRSLCAVENTGFMLTDRGIYVFTENGVEPVSSKIEFTLRQLSQADISRAFSVHHRPYREVWFYLPDIGVYVYNYRVQQWTGPFSGTYITPNTYCGWSTFDTSGNPITLIGSADGFVRRVDVPGLYLDDRLSDGTGGTSIVATAKLSRKFFGDQAMEKAYRWAYLTGNLRGSSSVSLSWATDAGSGTRQIAGASGVTWGSFTWGSFTWGGIGSLTYRIPLSGRGVYFDASIVDGGQSESTFSRLEVEGFNLARRG